MPSAARNYALNRQQEEIKRMEATSLALQSISNRSNRVSGRTAWKSTLIDSLENTFWKTG